MTNNTIDIAGQSSIFKRTFKRLRNVEILGIIITLIVECIILSFLSPYFLTAKNIINVLRAISINAIVTVGMTMVLISGGLDLSVGSVIGLGGMVTAFFLTTLGMSLPVALIVGISTGAIIGYTISLFVTKLNINSFIVTLGFLSVARGIIYLFSTGANIKVTNPVIIYLGQGTVGVIPVSVILMTLIAIAGAVFLKYSVTGRYIYAIGGNERAARLSGIRIENVRMLVFILTSALAAFAGIVMIGRLGTAEVIAGTGAEIDIIAAVIIGGTSLSGGKGSIIGSLIGAAIIGVLRNGFVILGLPIAAQTIGIGMVVILSVTIDSLRSRKAA
ncbi:MAG: ABC transporter permease [Actinobacteria bacterium]|nr:ABC transporter permease [Actinomycetota bacterium]